MRTQEPVGSIATSSASSKPAAASSPGHRGSAATSSRPSCVGVQLDDWRLVTGFSSPGSSGGSGGGCAGAGGAASSSSGGGGSNATWWHSGGETCAEDGPLPSWGSRHSLEVYDIRATSSFSSAAAAAAATSGGGGSAGGVGSRGGGSSRGLWSAPAVMSLPVPNRITCFQVGSGQLTDDVWDGCLLWSSKAGRKLRHHLMQQAWQLWQLGWPAAPRVAWLEC